MRPRPILLFGAGGRLGQAIRAAALARGVPVAPASWKEADAQAFPLPGAGAETDVIFAGGLTDPGAPPSDLMRANCELPTRIIEALTALPGVRFLTIGSALETFAGLAAANPYLNSKAALGAYIEYLDKQPCFRRRISHLRLHTLYGARPAPSSFLGQIFTSLRDRTSFAMSEGRQLREYAHVDDVARSILALLSRPWQAPVAVELNSGQPVILRELAAKIFAAFGCGKLLRVGALPTPPGENVDRRFPRSPDWLLGDAREPVQGIIDWLSERLEDRRGR